MKADIGVPVSEAADRLGVNPSLVRAMIRSGALDARKLGDRWLVDPGSLDRRETVKPPKGRPFSPKNAWALLLESEGGEVRRQAEMLKGLSPSALSRVRFRLRGWGIASLAPRLRGRARVQRLRAHPSDLPRIESEPWVVRGGASALREYGIDLVAPGEIEVYVQAENLGELKRKYFLEASSRPNVILHVVGEPWPFPASCQTVPAVVAALDLLEADDETSRFAGRGLLARLEVR